MCQIDATDGWGLTFNTNYVCTSYTFKLFRSFLIHRIFHKENSYRRNNPKVEDRARSGCWRRSLDRDQLDPWSRARRWIDSPTKLSDNPVANVFHIDHPKRIDLSSAPPLPPISATICSFSASFRCDRTCLPIRRKHLKLRY